MINDSMIKSGAPIQPSLSIFSHISQVVLQYIFGFLPFVESGHLKDFSFEQLYTLLYFLD